MKLITSMLILAALSGGLLCAQRRSLSEEELAQLATQQADRVEASRAFVEENLYRLGLDANATFKPADNPVLDEFGTLHVRFLQYYQGIRVRNGQVTTHLAADGAMLPPSNGLYPGVQVDEKPALTAEDALLAVRKDLAATNRTLSGMPLSAFAEPAELILDPIIETTTPEPDAAGGDINASDETTAVRGFRLLYRVLATPADEAADEFDFPAAYYFIDAATGRILRTTPAEASEGAREPATGVGLPTKRRRVTLDTTKANGQFELYDLTRGSYPGNGTRSNNNKESHKDKHTSTIADGSNGWGNNQRYSSDMPLNGETAQSPAVDIFWGVARTWDLLANVFHYKGLDGKNSAIRARAHYGVNYKDAHYNYGARAAYFGDGVIDPDPEKDTPPNIGLSTVSHELGHGVWGYHMATDYDRPSEASGLNEGHGDILGAISNFYTNVSQSKGGSLVYASDNNYFSYRSYNPPSYPSNPADPPFYNQTGRRYWQPGMGTFEEHVQGCAYGHMFVMLVEGASRLNTAPTFSKYFPSGMAGIGLHKAARIWFLASTAFAPSGDPTFYSMRNAWVEAAGYAYGDNSDERNAVINAWAAINVGKAVEDKAEPVLNSLVLKADETEGSLVLTASAADDTTPIVEFGLGGSVRATRLMPPYQTVIDISTLKPGTYTAFARAVDFAGKSTIKYAQFTVKGTLQALKNGSFEAGITGWKISTGNMIGVSATTGFLGDQYLRFRDDAQFATQMFKLPADTVSATLSVRYRVVGIEYLPGENLFIELYDPSINKVTPLADISSQEVTLDEAMRHYKRMEFDLTAFKNKNMELRLKASLINSNVTRFVVDAVSVTYTRPQSLSLVAELDEPAHLVRMRATPVGLVDGAIKAISYRINGQQVAIDSLSFNGKVYSNSQVPPGTYNVQAVAIRQDNSEILSNVVPITFTGKKNQVLNNDFEAGETHWSLPGLHSGIGTNNAEAQIHNAQSGTRYANFVTSGGAGNSKVRQLIAIPANPLSATVSIYLKMPQTVKDAGDIFRAALVSIDNQVLVPVATVTGATQLDPDKAIAGYTRFSVKLNTTQLSQIRGRTLYLELSVDQNNAGVTTFCVDDVSVYTPVLGVSN